MNWQRSFFTMSTRPNRHQHGEEDEVVGETAHEIPDLRFLILDSYHYSHENRFVCTTFGTAKVPILMGRIDTFILNQQRSFAAPWALDARGNINCCLGSLNPTISFVIRHFGFVIS
jgi:hypothetical protein